MKQQAFVPAHEIRASFTAAMSEMYRTEVPAYGTLVDLVEEINRETLKGNAGLKQSLRLSGGLERLQDERHGAIRLGKPEELSMMRRVFAIMGMLPVSYYDLSVAGIPVHSTAFRPVDKIELEKNPFRIFTSLLRLDMIKDEGLRSAAAAVLEKRDIFTDGAYALVEKAENEGGLCAEDAKAFVAEVLETFRWHSEAAVSEELYERLHSAHRLVADVVSFKGPHINHLTPCTLDIDKVQADMPKKNISPKAVVEGPPSRKCPILLRQTSFKALNEQVNYQEEDGSFKTGSHTARFGEIEQRGCALTPAGRALYDELLLKARAEITPDASGENAGVYIENLEKTFADFPDTWDELRREKLAYFLYSLTAKAEGVQLNTAVPLEDLIADGLVEFAPVIYEDFLPVSAAGIFQSNLGDEAAQDFVEVPNKALFENALGAKVLDEFELYASMEETSIAACFAGLGLKGRAA
ncbi:2-oxoadipate dioxygenase/decarboxylase HglS [Kordiimonas laminariae]|uniref:2-oxoadipate dioxygenase/decarboxylase HglS n=1 Tax=Kordiimonas laminariae TaxID=2917717 RepID=UPI001FF29A6D|nr:VOC family protein [Kordiimonas laminariae]MCK0071166.1 VOC family protein [Kordiimonas laminariae]